MEFLILVRSLSFRPFTTPSSECGKYLSSEENRSKTGIGEHNYLSKFASNERETNGPKLKASLVLVLHLAADPWRLFPLANVRKLVTFQTRGNNSRLAIGVGSTARKKEREKREGGSNLLAHG